jgi:glycosyltransferase involved in cell wall biosynthesis
VRLLHAIPRTDRGGAERLVLQLTEDAIAHGDDVVVASNGGVWQHLFGEMGAEHRLVPLERGRLVPAPSAATGLRRIIRQFQPDLIHTHSVGVTLAARGPSAGLSTAPVATTFHGVQPGHYAMSARALGVLRPQVVACSRVVATSLVEAGCPPELVVAISNAARLDPAGPERLAASRARFRLGSPLVLGIGRLVPQKAWHVLIEAARSFRSDADVVVAGDGWLDRDLQRAAAAAGGRVRFIGPTEDVAALIGNADCIVSTSEWEGLPLTLFEALGLGAALVTTRVDGVTEVLDANCAISVPVGDAAAVADAVNRVLGSPDEAARLSAGALAAAELWSPERMLARYRRLYARMLAAGRIAAGDAA